MADSLTEYLQRDMECEGLLECIHGLGEPDRRCFEALVESDEPLTVDEVAAHVDRERSTAYRAVQRLLHAGLVSKEQVNYDQGGYYHVYRPTDAEEAADDMQRLVDDWHAKVEHLIDEFRDEYGEDREAAAEG